MSFDLLFGHLEFVRQFQGYYGFETNCRVLCRKLGIRYVEADENWYHPGPPPTIFLTPERNERRRQVFTADHELGHFLTQASGVEEALIQIHGTYEDAEPYIEWFCNVAAAQIAMPDPMLWRVRELYGDTAAAVHELSVRARVSLSAAARRLVWAEEYRSMAVFVASGQLVVDTITHHFRLPLRRYLLLPGEFPIFSEYDGNFSFRIEDFDVDALRIPGSRRTVGVLLD